MVVVRIKCSKISKMSIEERGGSQVPNNGDSFSN